MFNRSPLSKFALASHIAASVGWFGALAAFLALNLQAVSSHDAVLVRSSYLGMYRIAWYTILPLSLLALGGGVYQALAGGWGLRRYRWVQAKLVLTVIAIVVFLAKLPLIGRAASLCHNAVRTTSLRRLGLQLALHATGGLVVLGFIIGVSVFKPWGMTGRGRIGTAPGDDAAVSAPRRRRSGTIVAVCLAVLAAGLVMHLLMTLLHG